MKDKKSFLEHYKKNMRGIFILFYLLLINGYIFGQDTLNVQNVRIDISEKQQIDSLYRKIICLRNEFFGVKMD